MGACSHPALFSCFVNGPATSAACAEHGDLPVVLPLSFIYPAAPGGNGLNQAASGPFLGHHSHTVAAYMSTRCVPIFLSRWPVAPGPTILKILPRLPATVQSYRFVRVGR